DHGDGLLRQGRQSRSARGRRADLPLVSERRHQVCTETGILIDDEHLWAIVHASPPARGLALLHGWSLWLASRQRQEACPRCADLSRLLSQGFTAIFSTTCLKKCPAFCAGAPEVRGWAVVQASMDGLIV